MLGPFATDTYLPSFNALAETFNVSPLLIPQTLSIYLLGFSFSTLVYGTLSDSFGRKPVILSGLVIFFFSSIGAANSNSFEALMFFRMLQGASAGAGSVIGRAVVRDLFSGDEAQAIISKVIMVFGVAPAIAPIIGGYLHVYAGWRSVFYFMALMALVMVVATYKYLPESLEPQDRQPFSLKPVFKNYFMALTHKKFLFICLSMAFAFAGFGIYIASAANFVLEILKLSETQFAWLFVPLISGIVLGSAMNSRLAKVFSPNRLIMVGFGVMFTASLVNSLYSWLFPPAVPWSIIPIVGYTFGMSLVSPGLTIRALSVFPKMTGMASSLQSFTQMLVFAIASGFVAPLLFGSALKLALGAGASVLLGLGCLLISKKVKE